MSEAKRLAKLRLLKKLVLLGGSPDTARLEWAKRRTLLKINFKTLVIRFQRSGWHIIIPLLAIVLVLIWWRPSISVPAVDAAHSHALYLLSAIAQSLAAVLALIVTISLIVAQLASRYSLRMLGNFFDRLTIAYILLLIGAVFLPFWLLTAPSPLGVKWSLTLAAASLLMLVPYFLSFRDKLDPERLIVDLQDQAITSLRLDPWSEPDAIIPLDNLIMTSFTTKDYDTFEKGVKSLAEIALMHLEDHPGEALLKRLQNISLVTLEDPSASIRTIRCITEMASLAVPRELQEGLDRLAHLFCEIGTRAGETRLDNIVAEVVDSLGRIGREALDDRSEDTSWVVLNSLERVGTVAHDQQLTSASQRLINSLGQIGVEGARIDLRDWRESMEWDGHQKGFLQRVAEALQVCAVVATAQGVPSRARRAASHLWEIGAWATLNDNLDLGNEVVTSLRGIEQRAHLGLVQSAYQELGEALWMFAPSADEPRTARDGLEKFKTFYESLKLPDESGEG